MDVREAVEGRRSINFFDTGRVLPDGKINELLELAALTPAYIWKRNYRQ